MKQLKLQFFLSVLLLLMTSLAKAEDVSFTLTAESLASEEALSTAMDEAINEKSDVTLVFKLADDCTTLTENNLNSIAKCVKGKYTSITGVDFSNITSIETLPANLFNGADKLATIKLPALTSLSNNLFTGCANLTSLTIGEWSNTEGNEGLDMAVIPSGCFQNCGNLTNLYFTNVEKVEGWAFEGCTSMTVLPIKNCKEGEEVEIGQKAFNNTKLTGEIVLPEGITIIKGASFAACKEMTAITLPTTIKSVDPEFDLNSTNLTHIKMAGNGSNNNYITDNGILYAINGGNLIVVRCPIANPEPIKIPATINEKTVTEIGDKAFHDCAMTTVELSDGLLKIGATAFFQCKNLTALTIPASVTDIANDFINDCTALATLTVKEGNPNYYTVEKVTYTKGTKDGDQYYDIFRIPEAATFEGNIIDLSNINDYKHVTGVGKNAFYGVKNVEVIKLPDTITKLEDECFKKCGLKTFYVPKSLTEEGFGTAPFSECENLTEFAPPSTEKELDHFYVDKYGILYNKAYNKLFKVPNNYVLQFNSPGHEGTFDIFHNIKEIQANAFEGVKNIKTVNVAQGIKKLPLRCFYKATSIKTVLIPNSVTEIGQDVFNGSGVENVIMLTTTKTAPKSNNGNYNSFYGFNGKIHLSEGYDNFKDEWVSASKDFESASKDSDKKKKEEEDSREYGWYGLTKDNENIRLVEDVKHRAIFENSDVIAGFNGENDNKVLNEADKSNTLTAQHYDYITLYRDFSKMEDGQYATLALPVDVTKATLVEAFGENTKVWEFAGRKDNYLKFNTVDLTAAADGETIIKKGIAILIQPEYKENSYLLKMNLGGESTEANAIALDESKVTSYSEVESENADKIETTSNNINYVDGKKQEGVTFKYGFYATYQKQSTMPAGVYYMLANGSFKYAVNSLWMKGLRGFVLGNDGAAINGDTQSLAKLSFDGFTTGIDDIVIDGNDHKAYDIYNVNGQLVRKNATSTEGLSKGLYIMNGKKVIVK